MANLSLTTQKEFIRSRRPNQFMIPRRQLLLLLPFTLGTRSRSASCAFPTRVSCTIRSQQAEDLIVPSGLRPAIDKQINTAH